MTKIEKHKLTDDEKAIRELSDRIVEAQSPIRILDAVKWDNSIKAEFFQHKFRKLPSVDKEYYKKIPLGFDPAKKIDEFYHIEHEIKRRLGKFSAASELMQQRCKEYRDVVHMLEMRGQREFTNIAQDLYGSSDDAFYAGAPTLRDLSTVVSEALGNIKNQTLDKRDEPIYTAQESVEILNKKLSRYFGEHDTVHVKVSDDIVADAAAGADTIKLRGDLKFSERVLQLYEVHEGWVHLGTTINGLRQPVCTFLSKGPPSCTVIQEGLAMLTEIFTFSSYPARVRRITNRIISINMAENGANFIEVFHFFREQGISDEESYQNTVRVFRGSTPNQGPFTKDLAYSKGFILIYNYLRLVIQRGYLSHIPLLFLGKISLRNIRLLAELVEQNLVIPPKYVPPQFSDKAGLSSWMSYSLFLNRLDLEKLAKDYQDIL